MKEIHCYQSDAKNQIFEQSQGSVTQKKPIYANKFVGDVKNKI